MKIGQPMDSRAITWDKSFAGRYSERFDKAQKFIDAECIRHMVKYTPTLSTNLRKSATRGTKIGSGKIQYLAPYARYQYYGKLWFERMKADKKQQILRGAAAIMGGKAK